MHRLCMYVFYILMQNFDGNVIYVCSILCLYIHMYSVGFDQSECDVEYDGSCYELVQQQTDWFSARTHCHNAGGYLADAYSADENNVIRQIVIDYGATGARVVVKSPVHTCMRYRDTSIKFFMKTQKINVIVIKFCKIDVLALPFCISLTQCGTIQEVSPLLAEPTARMKCGDGSEMTS